MCSFSCLEVLQSFWIGLCRGCQGNRFVVWVVGNLDFRRFSREILKVFLELVMKFRGQGSSFCFYELERCVFFFIFRGWVLFEVWFRFGRWAIRSGDVYFRNKQLFFFCVQFRIFFLSIYGQQELWVVLEVIIGKVGV